MHSGERRLMRLNKIPKTVFLLSIALLALLITGCYPDHNQSTFDPRGPVAAEQLEVFWWISQRFFGKAPLLRGVSLSCWLRMRAHSFLSTFEWGGGFHDCR